jgi:hypothetical protein
MLKEKDVVITDRDQSLEDRRAFLRLPIEQRRQTMARQANELMDHYGDRTEMQQRENWQGGDIVEL